MQASNNHQGLKSMKQTTTILSCLPYAEIAAGAMGIILFMGAVLGMMVFLPSKFSDAEKKAISAAGASYYAQVIAKCPSLQPQAEAMMADHNADRTEIRRMNQYVATANSIVGERACNVKPLDLDRGKTMSPVL